MTRYFRDYGGHILELPDDSTLKDLYCKICNRLLNVRFDLTPLIKYRGCLYEVYSTKGQAILKRRQRAQIKKRQAKINWRLAHPDYFKGYYKSRKQDLIQNATKNKQKRKQIDPEGYRQKVNTYAKNARSKPEVKKHRIEVQKIMRGLVKLGLGTDYQKRFRIRKKLKTRNLIRTNDPLALVAKTS